MLPLRNSRYTAILTTIANEKGAQEDAAGLERPRLIAVSKLHNMESILAAYDYGIRVFGENYVSVL